MHLSALCSSNQKSETGTSGHCAGTLIKMQLHTEGKQIDAFGELATKSVTYAIEFLIVCGDVSLPTALCQHDLELLKMDLFVTY